MVADLSPKSTALRVSAANLAAIANALKDAAKNKIPVLTWDVPPAAGQGVARGLCRNAQLSAPTSPSLSCRSVRAARSASSSGRGGGQPQ